MDMKNNLDKVETHDRASLDNQRHLTNSCKTHDRASLNNPRQITNSHETPGRASLQIQNSDVK